MHKLGFPLRCLSPSTSTSPVSSQRIHIYPIDIIITLSCSELGQLSTSKLFQSVTASADGGRLGGDLFEFRICKANDRSARFYRCHIEMAMLSHSGNASRSKVRTHFEGVRYGTWISKRKRTSPPGHAHGWNLRGYHYCHRPQLSRLKGRAHRSPLIILALHGEEDM